MASSGGGVRPVGVSLTVKQNGITSTFKLLNDELQKVRATNKKMTDTIKKSSAEFSKFGNSANKTLKSINSSCNKVATSIRTILATAIGIASNKILNMGVTTASSFNRVNQVFKSGTDDIMNWANELERIYGFNSNQLKDNVAIYKQLISAFGVGDKQATEMSKNLTTLAEDYALFRGMDVAQVSDAFKSGIIGQTESIQKLGIQIEQTMLKQVASNLGIKKSVKDMNDIELATMRYIAIMYQASDINGYYAKTMDNPVAKLQIFKNIWIEIGRTIGTILLELFNKISTFAITISLMVEKVFGGIAKLMGIDLSKGKDSDKGLTTTNKGIDITNKKLDETDKKAKKASNSLAAFDELVTVQKDTGDKGGVDTSGLGGTSQSNIFEGIDFSSLYGQTDTWLSDLRKKVDDTFSTPIKLGITIPEFNIPSLKEVDLSFGFNSAKAKEDLLGIVNNLLANFAQNLAFFIDITIRVFDDLGVGEWINSLLSTLNKLSGLCTTASTVMINAFNAFYAEIEPIVIWAGDKINDAILFIGELAETINTWVTDNEPLIISFTTFIGELCNGIWKLLEPLLDTGWEVAKTVISTTLDVVLGFGTWIMENKEAVTLAIIGIAGAIAGIKVAGMISYIDDLIGSLLMMGSLSQVTSYLGAFSPLFNKITGAITPVITGLKALWATMMANPIGLIIGLIVGIVAGVVLLYNNCEEFRNMVDMLWAKLKEWGAWIADIFVKMFDSAWESIKATWNSFKDTVGTVIKIVWDLLKSFIGFYGSMFVGAFTSAKEIILGVWDTMKTAIGGYIDGIKTTVGGVIDFITGVFTGDWEKAWNGVKKVFKGVWDSFESIAKAPLNAIITAINVVIRGINKINFSMPDWDWIPNEFQGKSFGINIPQIPKLAKGGVVDNATLAMIGEAGKEVVLPLENNTNWMVDLAYILSQQLRQSDGNGKGDVHIHVNADNFVTNESAMREFARQMKTYLDDFDNNYVMG